MKRLTATLLAAAMCMGTFAGCGSNTEETTDNSNAGAAAGETAAATTESQTASAENVHLDALNVYFVQRSGRDRNCNRAVERSVKERACGAGI